MKIQFSNAEVDVWKLRKGIPLVLSGSGDIVALKCIVGNILDRDNEDVVIVTEHFDGVDRSFAPSYYVWLDPH